MAAKQPSQQADLHTTDHRRRDQLARGMAIHHRHHPQQQHGSDRVEDPVTPAKQLAEQKARGAAKGDAQALAQLVAGEGPIPEVGGSPAAGVGRGAIGRRLNGVMSRHLLNRHSAAG